LKPPEVAAFETHRRIASRKRGAWIETDAALLDLYLAREHRLPETGGVD